MGASCICCLPLCVDCNVNDNILILKYAFVCMSLQALEVNERLNCVVEPYMEAEVRTLARICAICPGTPKCTSRILNMHILVSCEAFLFQRIIHLYEIDLIRWM